MTADGCWGDSVCESARETIQGNQFGDKKLIAYNVLNVQDVVPVDEFEVTVQVCIEKTKKQ